MIVFNTKYPDAPCSDFYRAAMKRSERVVLDDWSDYSKYKAALFMTYEKDLEDLRSAKTSNPDLITAIIDPRGRQVEPYLKYADFLIVDSLEMKDFFSGYGLPILLYSEYPEIRKTKKVHSHKEKIIIGYHGNAVHLAGMHPNITKAIEALAEKYSLEFWAMYNIKGQGRWRWGVPRNLEVKHIPWSYDNYYEYLANVDIGIAPNLMPIRNISRIKKKVEVWKYMFNDTNDDYLLRFKMPSNPGRIIVFAMLGIPVISDFYPSALQLIEDGKDGYLVSSSGGWYQALESLIIDHRLRQKFADRLQYKVGKKFDFDLQNTRLLESIDGFAGQGFSTFSRFNIQDEDVSLSIRMLACAGLSFTERLVKGQRVQNFLQGFLKGKRSE